MLEVNKFNAYIKWIIETYAEMRAQQAMNITHRVVDYHRTTDGGYKVSVQLIGKSIVFKEAPKKIIENDALLEAFSKKDIRLLTLLACDDSKVHSNEILSQKFVRKINKFLFRLKNRVSGNVIEKSAAEISADPELINTLSAVDAHKIGYITANEQFKLEKIIEP